MNDLVHDQNPSDAHYAYVVTIYEREEESCLSSEWQYLEMRDRLPGRQSSDAPSP